MLGGECLEYRTAVVLSRRCGVFFRFFDLFPEYLIGRGRAEAVLIFNVHVIYQI